MPTDLKPQACPKHCIMGHIGMDNCNTCGTTGSVYRVAGKVYPNTREGYIEACKAAGIEPILHD